MMHGHTINGIRCVLRLFTEVSLLVCYLIFGVDSVHAESVISVDLDEGPIVLNLSPRSGNGAFAQSDSFNIGVEVSGPGGYTLGISADDSTNLINQSDHTSVLTSISTAISVGDFSADTAAAGNNYNGKWGYLPSKLDSIQNSAFQPAPDSNGDVLDVTRGRDAQDEYTIAIGARADMNITPGSYVNTFVITAVSNYSCSVGEVCYFDNDADGGYMDNQSIPSGATEIELAGSNYYRAEYGFAGWSPTILDPDDVNFASDFANATVYGPNETVEIPVAGYLPLYAVWVPSSGNMQAWKGCSSLSVGDVIGLTDTRDGNVYAVAKLADGRCWQIENMRLDFSDEDVELTNMNSNHPTAQFMSDANRHPEAIESPGVILSPFDNVDVYSTDIKYSTDSLREEYARGIDYNYYTYMGGNHPVGESFALPNGDICPAGWSIPGVRKSINDVIISNYEYYDLVHSLTTSELTTFSQTTNPTATFVINALESFPNNFLGVSYPNATYFESSAASNTYQYSGMFRWGDYFYVYNTMNYSNVNRTGSRFRCIVGLTDNYSLSYDANGGVNAPMSESSDNGIFESITTDEPIRSGYTFIGWIDSNGVEVQPGEDYNAGVGNTDVTLYAMWSNDSCNDAATTIGTGNPTDAVCMQDMNGAVRNAMSDANTAAGSIQTFQLIDARDNQSYDIALLDDENVWMTKNLNLGKDSDTALNHNDTNIPQVRLFILKSSNNSLSLYKGELGDGYYNGVYYGGYYNWNTTITSSAPNEKAFTRVDSICPSGWALPTDVHFNNLKTAASLTNYANASATPYSFSNGGRLSMSRSGNNIYRSFTGQNTDGYYWTSLGADSPGNSNYAYYFYLTSSTLQTNQTSKSYALNVRCIASNGTVTVNYDGNGSASHPVRGSMLSQTLSIDTGNVSTNTYIRDNYVFRTWNTKADGSGMDVAIDSNIYALGLSDGDEITLYAQWTPQVVIIYDDNYSGVSRSLSINAGSSRTLGAYNYFTTKDGYSIKEWNTEPDGSGTTYAVGSTYAVPADLAEPLSITLYAQWVEDCTITFVNTESGETQTKDVKWNRSDTITPSIDWAYSGYRLSGWDTVTNAGLGGGGTVVYSNNQAVTLTSDLTIYTVWVPINTIQYDGNGATSNTTMSVTHEASGNQEINLYASNFKRDGYGFVGWSFDPNAASNIGSATIYGPNATIAAPAVTTPGEVKTLYAVWVEAESGVTMQTFDGTVTPYDTADIGTVIALTDSRDNDTYAVAKLADEKWWMIENLRLGGSSAITLTNSDTAISTASSTLSASTTIMSTSNSVISMNASNKLSPINPMDNGNANVLSYGNYYSWAAAVLSTDTNSGTTVTSSVCPYGWHLPSGNSSGEFANLSYELGGLKARMDAYTTPTGAELSKVLRNFPNNFMYSGYWRNNSSSVRGTNGYYWSSTSYGSNNAYYLTIDSTTLNPAVSYRYRYYGSSIRCIAN